MVTIPVGSVDGMPVGMSLVGRAGGDHELLGVARLVQGAVRFTGRPALHA